MKSIISTTITVTTYGYILQKINKKTKKNDYCFLSKNHHQDE